jgi:hypothetical protein
MSDIVATFGGFNSATDKDYSTNNRNPQRQNGWVPWRQPIPALN